jgi:beta-fructofuranosidase
VTFRECNVFTSTTEYCNCGLASNNCALQLLSITHFLPMSLCNMSAESVTFNGVFILSLCLSFLLSLIFIYYVFFPTYFESNSTTALITTLQYSYGGMASFQTTLFEKYRPISHFIAPHSWANDPCGAIYIPETQEYIICYQWNPGTTDAGNSAWGMAKSRNLSQWEDCLPALRNGTDTFYDRHGVFSGSITSKIWNNTRVLYLFYTSISHHPYPHWSMPYTGNESQSIAISKDYGKTWERSRDNPLRLQSPFGASTTGWRDPFVSEWPSLSEKRRVHLDTKYMLLSSGKKNEGPQLLLYESHNLLHWKEYCILVKGQIDAEIFPNSNIIWGRNVECASFFTIKNKDYLIFGMEGLPCRNGNYSARSTVWMSGIPTFDDSGTPYFRILSVGRLDNGSLYAPHIFRGAAEGELLQLGWIDEDENIDTKNQGWAGCLTVPRQLYEIRLPVPISPLSKGHQWEVDVTEKEMTTLGITPANRLETLRLGSAVFELSKERNTLPYIQSKTFELWAKLIKPSSDETIFFNVRESPNKEEVTSVIISLINDRITIDRSRSSLNNGNMVPVIGSFTLLNIGSKGKPNYVDLTIRIFVDNSVIEVFLNDTFALSSRIYPVLESSLGVSCWAGNGVQREPIPRAKFQVRVWAGLGKAWPGRPLPWIR